MGLSLFANRFGFVEYQIIFPNEKSLNSIPLSIFQQQFYEVEVKVVSGRSKLKELVEKTEFLKQNAPVLPDLWQKTLEDANKILFALQEQVQIGRQIFEDKSTDLSKIRLLDATLEKIAKICHNFQDFYQKSSPAFALVSTILNASTKLIASINFVYDVDPSMFRYHVGELKKDVIFFGDFNGIYDFIVNLYNFFSMTSTSSTAIVQTPINNQLLALKNAGGRFFDEYLPGVVYRTIPDIITEIKSITTKITFNLHPFLNIVENNFFEYKINKARRCLLNLVGSEKMRGDKPLKLEDFWGSKDKIEDIVILFDLLQFQSPLK